MKKLTLLFATLMLVATISKAQNTTAMDFNRTNCNGTQDHLFNDLDNGMAVVLFYYMPNCGSCPPPAKKVQTMLNNINKQYPNKVKAYAIPYNNTTKCTNVQTWVTSNGLNLFTAIDSGAAQVAYYGGMGMPSVVLVGGKDHRVMYVANQDNPFATKDTIAMRDSIMNLFNVSASINSLPVQVQSVNVFPNPATDYLNINLVLKQAVQLYTLVTDINGKTVIQESSENVSSGQVSKQINTANLPNGNYLLKLGIDGRAITQKISITR